MALMDELCRQLRGQWHIDQEYYYDISTVSSSAKQAA